MRLNQTIGAAQKTSNSSRLVARRVNSSSANPISAVWWGEKNYKKKEKKTEEGRKGDEDGEEGEDREGEDGLLGCLSR